MARSKETNPKDSREKKSTRYSHKHSTAEKKVPPAKKAAPLKKATPLRKTKAETESSHESTISDFRTSLSRFEPKTSIERYIYPSKQHAEQSLSRFYAGEPLKRDEITLVARHGVPKHLVRQLLDVYGIRINELSKILNVNEKTIRNYQTQDTKLTPHQGEQVIKMVQLLERGAQIFGSKDSFNRWLHKSAYGLDSQIPMDLLETSEGINLVCDEVERIAYGDFS